MNSPAPAVADQFHTIGSWLAAGPIASFIRAFHRYPADPCARRLDLGGIGELRRLEVMGDRGACRFRPGDYPLDQPPGHRLRQGKQIAWRAGWQAALLERRRLEDRNEERSRVPVGTNGRSARRECR